MRVSWITSDRKVKSVVEYGKTPGKYEASATGESTSYKYFFYSSGDLGQTEWTASTLSHVGARDYDLLLLPGDLSYADTTQPLWDSFGRLVEPYASTRPWMVTEGNHEIETFPIIYLTVSKPTTPDG
ncbi:UNVERIFIED_CONTAM: Purple acid phosphatase 22 [Sesamum latifolium]|uniref:Purple acid phosphatase n=1 Tax=Sesamum latifolium TaxID=2727402 RepID=A0AAW2TZX7_9LAMI